MPRTNEWYYSPGVEVSGLLGYDNKGDCIVDKSKKQFPLSLIHPHRHLQHDMGPSLGYSALHLHSFLFS